VIAIPAFGRLPVHQTNIHHYDPIDDVSNPNIDIAEIRSYALNDEIVLELIVAGIIVSAEPSSENSSGYMYRLMLIARGLDEIVAHEYSCTYRDGIVSQFDFMTEVENSTLRIFFSKNAFIPDSYMIGLEASAAYLAEEDYTLPDRAAPVARFFG
jgi:hypothetical protein